MRRWFLAALLPLVLAGCSPVQKPDAVEETSAEEAEMLVPDAQSEEPDDGEGEGPDDGEVAESEAAAGDSASVVPYLTDEMSEVSLESFAASGRPAGYYCQWHEQDGMRVWNPDQCLTVEAYYAMYSEAYDYAASAFGIAIEDKLGMEDFLLSPDYVGDMDEAVYVGGEMHLCGTLDPFVVLEDVGSEPVITVGKRFMFGDADEGDAAAVYFDALSGRCLTGPREMCAGLDSLIEGYKERGGSLAARCASRKDGSLRDNIRADGGAWWRLSDIAVANGDFTCQWEDGCGWGLKACMAAEASGIPDEDSHGRVRSFIRRPEVKVGVLLDEAEDGSSLSQEDWERELSLFMDAAAAAGADVSLGPDWDELLGIGQDGGIIYQPEYASAAGAGWEACQAAFGYFKGLYFVPAAGAGRPY